MRKPLAVVCGVAAAVLIAGGVYATTAGADEAPAVPGAPALDMPEIPQLPADADAGTDTGGAPAVTFPDLGTPDGDQDQPDQRPGGQQDQQDQQDQPDQRPGGQQDQQERPAPQDRPVQQPAAHQPAPPARQNDQPGTKAGTVLAAAQREVTPDSVSTSPAAPVQQQVLALVNDNRERGGCGDLTLDRRLIEAAYGHAVDMARRGYFAHESPDGEGSSDRMSAAGYRWSRYGENIARGQDSVYEVVNGWMHSPVHRENIMDCQLRQMGIGLAFAPDRTPYWVQDFATPQ
jgi:uncharacterized protein YkwD